MKRIIILFTIIILMTGCGEELIQPTIDCTTSHNLTITSTHPKSEAIQAVIDEGLAKGLPGMTILISDSNGTWIGTGGYADLENQIKMQTCHINKLGSVTKMMLGTLTWLLIQDGLLEIDEPIKTYIPDVANRLTNGNEITLAMLLNHTSGLADVAGDLNFNLAVVNDFTKSWTSEEILGYLEGKSATHAPGTAVKYSNSNTMIEALVIEKVTGRQHGELLKERILEPLGMNSTVYYDYSENFPFDRLAQGYLDLNNNGGSIQNISKLNPGSGNGYTGVYSTVADLYLFMNALLKEKTLITPANLNLILSDMYEAPGGGWKTSKGGIHDEWRGLLGDDRHAYGHGGGDIGYSANLNYFPSNNTIFAATYNYGVNLPTAMREDLGKIQEKLFVIMAE